MSIHIRPLTPHLGADVTGVDLNQLQSAHLQTARGAFARHGVLAFRGRTHGT